MSEERDELRRIKDYYFCEQISWPELELRIRSYGDERERAGIEAVINDLESEHRYNVSCLGNPWNKGLRRAIDLAGIRLLVNVPAQKEPGDEPK